MSRSRGPAGFGDEERAHRFRPLAQTRDDGVKAVERPRVSQGTRARRETRHRGQAGAAPSVPQPGARPARMFPREWREAEITFSPEASAPSDRPLGEASCVFSYNFAFRFTPVPA